MDYPYLLLTLLKANLLHHLYRNGMNGHWTYKHFYLLKMSKWIFIIHEYQWHDHFYFKNYFNGTEYMCGLTKSVIKNSINWSHLWILILQIAFQLESNVRFSFLLLFKFFFFCSLFVVVSESHNLWFIIHFWVECFSLVCSKYFKIKRFIEYSTWSKR